MPAEVTDRFPVWIEVLMRIRTANPEDEPGPASLHAVAWSGGRGNRAVIGLGRAIDSGEVERMLIGYFS
jgi:hypothetical protein